MELLILGKNRDDKGTQLEELTKSLLQKLGYTDVVVNEIKAGGQEIDVRAELRIPSPGGEQKYRVICECKATKDPVSMPLWLKFLGKVYIEEAQLNKQVNGCFIALSGVNGNVAGSFDQLHENRENIELVSGDGLVRLMTNIFGVIPRREINDQIRNSTSRQVVHIYLCYYDHKIYWFIEFEDKYFSLLKYDGSPLLAEDAQSIEKLLLQNTDVQKFVDLEAEIILIQRTRIAEKTVLTGLMLLGGVGSCEKVKESWIKNPYSDGELTFSDDDLHKAAKRLSEKRLLNIDETGNTWILLPEEEPEKLERVFNIYKALLFPEHLIPVLGCDFYDEHINQELLSKICEIQGGIVLPDDKLDDCLKLLRLSPSALTWSLFPQPIFVQHRKDISPDERMDRNDGNYFIVQLLTLFHTDFYFGSYEQYFHSVRHIREVETRRQIEVKGIKKTEQFFEVSDRLAIGKTESLNGEQIVKFRLLDDTPDPWDIWSKLSDKDNQESEDVSLYRTA